MKHIITTGRKTDRVNLGHDQESSFPYLLLTIFLFFVAISNSVFATTFTCQTPTAGGVFTISLKSATDNCGPIAVNIPAGSTATQKAALIAAKIGTSCVGVFVATSSGADVTVTNGVHPGQRVFFKFGPDATGEKDAIEKSLQPSDWDAFWGATAPLFTCSGTASGHSYDTVFGGKIYIGTSTYMATVMTTPGESPFAILNDARNQLLSHGLTNVDLYQVSAGVWGLTLHVLTSETQVIFGNDDTGAVTTFEMFEPQTPQFKQLNFNYDGILYPNSDWGAIDLTFMGSPGLLYLNLAVGSFGWVIQNMPVQTLGNVGALQTQRFWFHISTDGVPVAATAYGYSLTAGPSGMPAMTSTGPVTQDFVIIQSGATGGGTGNNHPPAAVPQVGGAAVQPAQQHKNFPNQEAGVNECVPVGISNSLQFLNAKNNLGMNAADIGIPGLKGGTGWGPGGCPRPGWVENKKTYVKNKKLPITTRKLDGPANMKNIGAEIAAGQDVEMDIKWKGPGAHCVCVTGWVDLGGGKYKITITHDSKQGQAGGTVSETATYDSNTKTWGGALVNGTKDFFFVVECPSVNLKQVTPPTIPPSHGYKDKTNGGSSYQGGKYVITNMMISNFSTSDPYPSLGNMITSSYVGTCDAMFSSDSGVSFIHVSGPVNAVQSTMHSADIGGTRYFETEMLSLNLSGGPVMIRESPTIPSVGQTSINDLPGMFQIDSFFDVFTELSVDGGASWIPSFSGSSLLEQSTQSVTINQLNFNYNGTLTELSDWGAMDLTFPGSPDVQYLNLTINGTWVIQNMPVQSLDRSDVLQTQRFWFPIGPAGIPVELVQYGYTLTPAIGGQPASMDIATVTQDQIVIYSGDNVLIGIGDNHPPAAIIQVGGAIVQAAALAKGFPNQEAGINECVPVGISNSLNYLNNKNGLGMKPADIGIPGLKGGTGWGPGGCPRPGWVENKKTYVKNKKLPITTRKLAGPANIKNIGAELAAGQDVEMDIKWKGPGAHCVCVTGWTNLGGGKYKITITHDSKQGQAGGTVTESAIYDSNTGTWTGALVNGTNDFFFVVECPTITLNLNTPLIPPGSSNKYKPHSGSQYNNGVIQLENYQISNFTQTMPPPPVGITQFVSYMCNASLDLSTNMGIMFTHWNGLASLVERVTRRPDSLGKMFFETEILSMNLAGPPLPGGMMIRESPTLQSVGEISMSTIPGGLYHIDSFFDVFTELSMDGGVSWIPQDEPGAPGSTLLEVDGPAIPDIRTVESVTVGDGEYDCYDATQTIIIAGNGNIYHIGNGGNVTMISGQNILYEPGTLVDPGGYLHGYITTTGDYCSTLRSAVVTIPPPVINEEQPKDVTANSLFRIYPNPTSGNFTLELNSGNGISQTEVEIFSMRGEKVFSRQLDGSVKHELSLSGNPVGIYFVRVISGEKAETAKIIKQ